MDLHKLLIRQMVRLGLDEQSPPTELKSWQALLEFISNAYAEAEQERYLIERSIEVSSSEFLQLTEKLETAQHIAHLGYWSYDESDGIFTVSDSLYRLFGLQLADHRIHREQFLELVHEEDRPRFEELIEKALREKTRIEQEVRIKNADGIYNWFNIIADSNQQAAEKMNGLSGISMDINQRKKVEQELEISNQQLISTARMAGMADVAISVLHNVGNTLNSANVAIGIIQETMDKPNFSKLSNVMAMMKANGTNLAQYITEDAKGKLIPEYLIALTDVLENDHKIFVGEVANISRSIKHVKDIIMAQQLVSKVNGVIEKVYLPEVLEDALKIGGELFSKKGIKTSKQYENVGFIRIDKTKVIQILVNLIQNAQEACLANENAYAKQIDFFIRKNNDQDVDIVVEDNGVGISPDNLKKLFSFGFTTKEKGHGFGLHSSILAAQELGGELKAESKGLGQGAIFTLTLPLTSTPPNPT